MTRDCLVQTFGVLLAGLLSAEKQEKRAWRPEVTRPRRASGVYQRPPSERVLREPSERTGV